MSMFVCDNCGSTSLAYQKYVKCVNPVQIQEDETVVYLPSAIDEDDSLGVNCGFCCAHCGTMVHQCAAPIGTEGELLHYLGMTEDERKRQNDAYFASVQAEYEHEEQLRQEFEESICEIVED